MATKTYSVRVSQTVGVSSDDAASWLNEAISSGAVSLADDPGPGPKTLRLSLDAEKVAQGAKASSETESVFLRRLIASRVRVEEEKSREKVRPKLAILPRELRVSAEQLEPAVAGIDSLQSLLLSRVVRDPEVRADARMTPDEKADLSRTGASLINRRCPAWLAENIDVVGAVLQIGAIESRVISRAYEAAAARRKQRQQKQSGTVLVPAEIAGVADDAE